MAARPRIARLDGSGTAGIAAADATTVWPKLLSTIVRSLMSTVPSPVNSPWLHVAPVWPKWLSTIVRSLMSTRPSRFASPERIVAR